MEGNRLESGKSRLERENENGESLVNRRIIHTAFFEQVSMGPGAKILLEEKATDGKIYAVCPIETYPGLAIQSVADSSR